MCQTVCGAWTAPVAALYYKPRAMGYRAPQGYITGKVDLKGGFDSIGRDLLRLARAGAKGVGVLVKTRQQAKRLATALKTWGIPGVALLGPDDVVRASITVGPILFAKGLEFDGVIIAGVDKTTFTDTDFDRRLLYLASTRAKHWLHLHWTGTLASVFTLSMAGTTQG